MIKVGIIGAGYWGPNLIRNINNNSKASIVTVCDVRPGRLEFISGQYPGIGTTADMNEIINDESIDAVIIATPVNTHKDIALKCLERGKHVFVEKPLTDNYNDAVQLVNKAEEVKRILAVGHIFQFAPAVTAIKNFISDGNLGECYHLTSTRINLGPPKTTVDVVWDLAPHDLSILLYLYEENPVEVIARGSSSWWKGTVDNAHILMKFESGRTAHIHVGWLSSNKTRRTMLFGENGSIEYDETKAPEDRVIFYDKGIDNRINAKDNEAVNLKYGQGEVRNLKLSADEPLALEMDVFLSSIISGVSPVNGGKIGAEVVRILELVTKSINNNK
jgi:predicted dehydrogenase